MKRKGLLLAVCLFMSSLVFGQMVINPKGGINFSGINDEPEGISTNNRIGLNVGVDFRIGDGTVFFQPGLFFYQYNQEYNSVDAGIFGTASFSQDIKVQSLKLPLMLGFAPVSTGLFTLRFHTGPAFNFPINVDAENEGFQMEREDYKPVSVGAAVGAGIDVAMLTFDFNYEFGLSDYVEFQGDNISSSSSRQYVISLAVGVKF